ncbi:MULTISPECIES: tetratricopeptide repeat protein [unclassified Candidatus Cardinium]|uniref:tetratricopeptide repeat protein n=1 Tax=unclassified Candidatus Cardinium TaxID=2641185 RepID=UPI001FB1E695|nr:MULTISPECIES: tetratricopeptide repeat protein [unclassified Candidatus Cardinium]
MLQPIYSAILIAIFLMAIPYQGFSMANDQLRPFAQAIFHEGIWLFKQHQYAAAEKYFQAYLNTQGKKYNKEEAAYHIALSALANQDRNLEIFLQYFITRYPSSRYIETMRYYLAKCFFESGQFAKSLSLYQTIQADCLAPKERVTLEYAIGDSYLQLKDWTPAKKYFTTISNKNHPYYHAAQLQMAYIAFQEADYDGALVALEKASKKYSLEAQSLTLKVYHKAGQFESLLAYVGRYPDASFSKQDHLVMADAYFFLKQYAAAITHYQIALDNRTDRMTRAKLGHAFYETEQYAKAVACFQQLLHQTTDYASQMAAYYSGLIYEKEGAIPAAIAAFSKAEGLRFDGELSDLAAIKVAGLRYQQGAITEVIAAMTAFVANHEESKNLSTAQALLVQCYYKTKAYQRAIDYIATLPYKTETLLKLYQKVLFYQGIEDYNQDRLEHAIQYLKQSLVFPFKPSLVLQAQFWLGEAFSALGKYEKGLKFYTKCMQQGNLNKLFYEKNLYGLAYSYFNTGAYTTAAKTFEQYIAITQKQPAATHYDAILRLADCYYVKKDYQQALNLYADVYTYNPAHVRYQEALIYEALGDNPRAERCLQEVLTNHTETIYYEKACYHKACTIFNAGNYQAAIQAFSHLMQIALTTDLQPELLMKRALAYENLQRYKKAAADYAAILDQYPSHAYAESALMALSNLCSTKRTPEKTEVYLEKYAHIAKKMASHSDERTIGTAKQLFYNQTYAKVLQQLTAFDKQYPGSPLLGEAYFLIAESYYRLQKQNEAISYYKKLVATPQTTFHKKAYLRIADLAYEGKRFQEAVTYYQKLQKMQLTHKEYHQTLIGLIKGSFMLKKYQITTPACLELLNSAKEAPIETTQQASLYLGKVAMQRAEYKRAKSHFLKASRPLHTITAAEAQYLLAHVEFKLKAYQPSLNILFDLVEKFPQNNDYIDRAFLLMADNYMMLGNFTQAKATLDSMINNSKDQKQIELAKQKRGKVVAKLQ